MKKKYQEAVIETLKEFNQLDYIKDFDKKNYKHYHIKVNLKDKEIINHLEKQDSKNGYILDLIRKDIKENK
jgi:hypothetical protein